METQRTRPPGRTSRGIVRPHVVLTPSGRLRGRAISRTLAQHCILVLDSPHAFVEAWIPATVEGARVLSQPPQRTFRPSPDLEISRPGATRQLGSGSSANT